MDIISFLGSAGTLIGLVRAVPQLIRLLRIRTAQGVSLDTAATSAIVSFGWATYGLLTHQVFVCLATGSSGLIFAVITLVALRLGRRPSEFRVAPLWLLVLILAGWAAGQGGLALALPISVLVANTPQLRVAYRESSLAGLSLGTWLLSLADGLVWGVYALMQRDAAIIAYALFQVLTSSVIIARKLTPAKISQVHTSEAESDP